MEKYLFLKNVLGEDCDYDSCYNYGSFPSFYQLLTKRRIWKPRIQGYVEDIVPLYNDHDFRAIFKLHRCTAEEIIKLLGHWRLKEGYNRGTMEIDSRKAFLVYLYFMASQDSYLQLADRFGISDSTAHAIVFDTVNVLFKNISDVIQWPQGQRVEFVKNEFRKHRNIDGIIGAMDGTHIRILAPREHSENYINRKSFHSVVLQVVCDRGMILTDVYCGWPGSVHDARVFRNSSLYHKMCQNSEDVCPNGTFLIGDGAYPLSGQLLTPYKNKNNLTAGQKAYNFCHSSTRMVVERTIGMLKGRFTRLQMLNIRDMKMLTCTILSACVLHNLCLNLNDLPEENEMLHEDEPTFPPLFHDNIDGISKRDLIMHSLSM